MFKKLAASLAVVALAVCLAVSKPPAVGGSSNKSCCTNVVCQGNSCQCCNCTGGCKEHCCCNCLASDELFYEYMHKAACTIEVTAGSGRRGWGTGFFFHAKNGTTYIWTAAHVTEHAYDADNKEVTGKIAIFVIKFTDDNPNGHTDQFPAEVVRYSSIDGGEDLCLLKLSGHDKYGATVRFSKTRAKLGAKVTHIGTAGGDGYGLFASAGTVGRLGVTMEGKIYDHCNASSLPGCSGGPIFSRETGEVIGMLTRGRGETCSAYVPVNRIRKWAKAEHIEYAIDSTIDVTD